MHLSFGNTFSKHQQTSIGKANQKLGFKNLEIR